MPSINNELTYLNYFFSGFVYFTLRIDLILSKTATLMGHTTQPTLLIKIYNNLLQDKYTQGDNGI